MGSAKKLCSCSGYQYHRQTRAYLLPMAAEVKFSHLIEVIEATPAQYHRIGTRGFGNKMSIIVDIFG
jgi:hypothetical protein